MKEQTSKSLRLWHALNGTLVMGLIATILLRKSFLKWRIMAAIIGDKLKVAGVNPSDDLLKDISRTIMLRMWEWHYPMGVIVAGLMIFRIVTMIRTRENPFRRWSTGGRLGKLQAVLYGLFYLALLVLIVTGLSMRLIEKAPEFLESIHEFTHWYVLGFFVAHLLGLLKAELTNEPGLVSNMIHGKGILKVK